jgi:two-component system nitrogen regulation response regulator GlnG
MSTAAMSRLQAFNFPGNVRQLENICHWLTVMAPAQQIALKDLPPEVLGSSASVNTAVFAGALSSGVGLDQSKANLPEAAAMSVPGTAATPLTEAPALTEGWLQGLGKQAEELLSQGHHDVWDQLSHQFEAQLLRTALAATHGRRVEAASRLGIGRNTITRKLQELGLENENFRLKRCSGHSLSRWFYPSYMVQSRLTT